MSSVVGGKNNKFRVSIVYTELGGGFTDEWRLRVLICPNRSTHASTFNKDPFNLHGDKGETSDM